MKKLFLALLCAGLANTAWAQTPVTVEGLPVSKGPTVIVQGAPPAPVIQTVPAGSINACLPTCPPTCAPACPPKCQPVCAPKCAAPCAQQFKTVCVPETGTRIKVTINYSSTCEKVCFPKCNLLWFLKGGCDTGCNTGCEQGGCASHVYTKRFLVKHVCAQEETYAKCVAVTVPACETSHCAGTPVIAPPIAIPAPLPKR